MENSLESILQMHSIQVQYRNQDIFKRFENILLEKKNPRKLELYRTNTMCWVLSRG